MNQNTGSTVDKSRWIALSVTLVAAVLVVVVRLLPYELRGGNFAPAGAMFLFAGARLRPRALLVLPFAPLAATDLYFQFAKSWDLPLANYLAYAAYLLIGSMLLRRSASALRTAGAAVFGSLLFFAISNFAVWADQAVNPNLYVGSPSEFLYSPDLAGLVKCYIAGIPFLGRTLLSDIGFAALFFGAYAVLLKASASNAVLPAAPVAEERT